MVLYLNTSNDYGVVELPKFDELTVIVHLIIERKLPQLKSYRWLLRGDVALVMWNDHDSAANSMGQGVRVRDLSKNVILHLVAALDTEHLESYVWAGAGAVDGSTEMTVYYGSAKDYSAFSIDIAKYGDYVVEFAGGSLRLEGGNPMFVRNLYVYSKVLSIYEYESIINNPYNPPRNS
ncbi:hypothetical protein DRJ19_05775, partial [Candidatus Woesearchaeota archaeon]